MNDNVELCSPYGVLKTTYGEIENGRKGYITRRDKGKTFVKFANCDAAEVFVPSHWLKSDTFLSASTAFSDETGRETCWLIEQTRHTVYLMADGNYTRDPLKASRFATRGEADAVLRSLNLNAALYKETIVTEHVFLNNAALSAAPAAQEPVAALRAANTANYLRILARESESAFDRNELKRSAELIEAVTTSSPATSAGAILETLREHHKWHLESGPIGLPDGEGGWIEIDNGAEYSDSALYERTAKLLEGAPAEELQPMPRGGMNTWWWQQAVLLRRKVRELTKTIEANAALASPSLSAAPVGEPTREAVAAMLARMLYNDATLDESTSEQRAHWLAAADAIRRMYRRASPVAQEPVAYRWPKALAIYRADDQWHCDISFAACPTDEELAALHDFLNKNHKHTSPPATSAGVGAEEIARATEALFQYFCPSIRMKPADVEYYGNAVRVVLALLSRAGDQK